MIVARGSLTIFIVSNIPSAGGMEQQTTQLALALKNAGHRVVFFSRHWVPSTSQYLKALRSAGVAVISPGRLLSSLLGDYEFQTCIVESWVSLAKPFLIPVAIIDSIIRRRRLSRSLQGAVGRLRGMFSHVTHRDRLDYLLYWKLVTWGLRWHPDIVHLHGYQLSYGRLLGWIHRHGWQTVYTERSCPSPDTPRLYSVALLKKAGAVIAISDAGRDAIREVWGFDGYVHRIPQHIVNDPYPEGFVQSGSVEDDKRLVVTCISRLSPEKGIDYLIRAVPDVLKEFPETHFLVAGGGRAQDSLLSIAEELGVSDSIRFIGTFEHQDLRAIMEQADIIVQPSRSEGLGGSLIEAMAYGKPIVASAAGGMVQLVQHGINGLLVPPRDPCSLASALNQLLCDPVKRRQMGLAGRDCYERGPFTAKTVVQATVDVYTHVLNSSTHSTVLRKTSYRPMKRGTE